MEPQLTLTLSAILSLVALAASVLSPILTSLLTNRHHRKMFDLEFYAKHRAEAIEKYLSSAGAAIRNGTQENLADYGRHSGEIYFYIPCDLWWRVDQIDLALMEPDYKAASDHLSSLCKELTEYPPRGKKKHCRHKHM